MSDQQRESAITARFSDAGEAEAAVVDLRRNGIHVTPGSRHRLEDEMADEVGDASVSGLVVGPKEMARGYSVGVVAGFGAGLGVGLILALVWLAVSSLTIAAAALIAGAGAVAGAVAGFVLGGGLGAQRASGGTDLAGDRSRPMDGDGGGRLIEVAPANTREFEQARRILEAHHPAHVDYSGAN